MKQRSVFGFAFFFLLITAGAGVRAQFPDDIDESNLCVACHGNADIWEADTQHLFVSAKHLAGDIHWQQGLKCADCHGGDPESFELREAHSVEAGFRPIETPADEPGFCGYCHSNAEKMAGYRAGNQPDAGAPPAADVAKDVVAEFWNSVHGKHLKTVGGESAASCSSCHPKHAMLPADDAASQVHPGHLVETCGKCHQEQRTAIRKGVHHAAGERNALGAGTPLDCLKCHGENVHGMPPVKDQHSPVFLDHQVRVCGSCHEKYLTSFEASVHGHGLNRSGLVVTAVCADCHGAHDIYYAADKRSTLHTTNVADTCGECHAFIEERLMASVHGQGTGPGGMAEHNAPGGKEKRKPSCTDCHRGHDLPHPESAAFHQQLPNRCGNCHPKYASLYGMSLHGQLTQLGFAPAAECSDCHGAHDILPIADPASRLSAENRVETCRQCHPGAVRNFTAFDPHADYKDHENYPLLHNLHVWIEAVLYLLFLLFVLHGFLWFTRSLIQTLTTGRHRRLAAGQTAVVRYEPVHRWLYVLLILSFFGLALTGLPLKYGQYPWARHLAVALGGFESTRVFHQALAALVVVVAVVHGSWIVRLTWSLRKQGTPWKQLLLGPDSPVPNARDVRDMVGMAFWFVGLTRKPKFERWTYWEKFDYWAVYLAMFLVGGSGLVLWFPNWFALVLPGEILNVAQLIHSTTALLVGGCLFMIHFFNTHLRPEKFPLDVTVMTGLISEEHLRIARPEYVARLEREGRLPQMRVAAPSRERLRAATLAGFVIVTVGLVLVAWMLLAYLGK